jgi:MFS family permease
MVCQPQTTSPDQSKDNHAVRILTCGRLRRVPHGLYQCFNLPPEGNSGTGIVFAIFQIGQMVGALFSWVSDWHGRRWPIFIGCLGTCIGAIVTAVAPTISAFIGGRFMLSFFSTIATAAAPMYLIEIAPPQHRGTVAGLYNTLYYLVRTLSLQRVPSAD